MVKKWSDDCDDEWNNAKGQLAVSHLAANTGRIFAGGKYKFNYTDKCIYDFIKSFCWDNQNTDILMRNDCTVQKNILMERLGLKRSVFNRSLRKLVKLKLIEIFHRISYAKFKNGNEIRMVKAFRNNKEAARKFRINSKKGRTLDTHLRCFNPEGCGQIVTYKELNGGLKNLQKRYEKQEPCQSDSA